MHLRAGGYETKSRVLKLLPMGNIPKMEEELAIYIKMLREFFETMSLDDAIENTVYVYA